MMFFHRACGIDWARKGAHCGDAPSQLRFAVMLGKGQGIPRDSREAAFWLDKAARQGLPEAQIQLALAYAHGQGVVQSDQDAYLWFQLATRHQPVSHVSYNAVAMRLSAEQRAEIHERARHWTPENN